MRVNQSGNVQFHDSAGSGWTNAPGLENAVTFDPDVSVTPLTHNLLIEMHLKPVAADSFFDVTVTDATNTVFTATGLKLFNTGAPDDTLNVGEFIVTTSKTANFVIDNVSLTPGVIPEPASVMLVLAGLGLTVLRRRS